MTDRDTPPDPAGDPPPDPCPEAEGDCCERCGGFLLPEIGETRWGKGEFLRCLECHRIYSFRSEDDL